MGAALVVIGQLMLSAAPGDRLGGGVQFVPPLCSRTAVRTAGAWDGPYEHGSMGLNEVAHSCWEFARRKASCCWALDLGLVVGRGSVGGVGPSTGSEMRQHG